MIHCSADATQQNVMESNEQPRESRWRRWVSLALACMTITMAGTIITFTSFAADLKKEFNLTQHPGEWAVLSGYGTWSRVRWINSLRPSGAYMR